MNRNQERGHEQSHAKPRSRRRSFAHFAPAYLLLATLFSLHSHGAPADQLVADDMETRMRACTPCHGAQGQGTDNDYFPRLAGKPAGYLYNQLAAFRSGRRHYSPMNYLLEYQNDDYLKAIAAYFASQMPPFPRRPPVTASSAVLAHGEELATHGDASRSIPACASCHNPSFTGAEPGIPALVGLKNNYISAQLGAFRYGTRTAAAPDCMQLVAARLSEDDVTALAAWLSSLPAQSTATPMPQGSLRTPLPCGSEPR
jgi:cytochrome c553